MKRDFKDEYQNYIESDVPDLWSCIEPNLSPRQGTDAQQSQIQNTSENNRQTQTEKKIFSVHFLKTVIPVAAALCVLVIGVRVIRMQGNMISDTMDETTMQESAVAEEINDAEAMPEEVEEAAQEVEEAAQEVEEAAQEVDNTNTPVEIERAVLSKISIASEEMQEKGYAYVYTFQLEDDSTLLVYVTNAQCDSMEDEGLEVERKEAYSLVVYPISESAQRDSLKEGECFLQKIEKLP